MLFSFDLDSRQKEITISCIYKVCPPQKCMFKTSKIHPKNATISIKTLHFNFSQKINNIRHVEKMLALLWKQSVVAKKKNILLSEYPHILRSPISFPCFSFQMRTDKGDLRLHISFSKC